MTEVAKQNLNQPKRMYEAHVITHLFVGHGPLNDNPFVGPLFSKVKTPQNILACFWIVC